MLNKISLVEKLKKRTALVIFLAIAIAITLLLESKES